MNYNLAQTVTGHITDDYNHSMPYGSMPYSMLQAKFEETNAGEDEDLFDNFAKNQLVDWGPDTNQFAHEESRGGVNRNSAALELRYNGHRGNSYDPYRPEHFDGFMDGDPRGTNVDPDFKQLVRQQESRMRFHRFTDDGAAHITGGGISEAQVMENKQKVFKATRDRLKVFDRQLDGRTEGLRRTYNHKSNVKKQIVVQSYGDAVADYALNPQRRANLIAKKIIRDTAKYRANSMDCDLSTIDYSQLNRKTMRGKVRGAEVVDIDSRFDDGDTSKSFKSAGLLMANIVKCKQQQKNTGDIDMSTSADNMTRKTALIQKDLSIILQNIAQDSKFSASDNTLVMKNALPQQLEHVKKLTSCDHHENMYINADIIYKSVKPGADTTRLKDKIRTDSTLAVEDNSKKYKSAKLKLITGRKLATDDDADKQESMNTANYRGLKLSKAESRNRQANVDGKFSTSDNTQSRKINHTNYRAEQVGDTEQMMRYNDNAHIERHGGRLGSKYTMGLSDRETDDRMTETGLLTG